MENTFPYDRPEKSGSNYSFLSSTNLIYREQLPPHYSLPTLVPRYSPELRGLNNIDNEEQIPDINFRDAFPKFDIDLSQYYPIDTGEKNQKLRKTYSENELSKYDSKNGRRKSMNANLEGSLVSCGEDKDLTFKVPRNIIKLNKEGIFDEYIPNFADFNLGKFGIYENAISGEDNEWDINQFSIEKQDNGLVQKHDLISEDGSELSQQVTGSFREVIHNGDASTTEFVTHRTKPIEIGHIKPDNETEYFEVTEEFFHRAASPERESDRFVISSIPKHFQSLSFSYRKQMLFDLLPENLKNDVDYRNHITKILRKNSCTSLSNSSISSMFTPSKACPNQIEPNTNEMGSILMDNWKVGRVINRGRFGIVRECFNINDGKDIKAVKVIPIQKNVKLLRKFQSEVIIWSRLHHPSCVPLLDLKFTSNNLFLLMPLYDEGSLFDKVKDWENRSICVNERFSVTISYLRGITESLKFIHSVGIHHGDIKLENYVLHKGVPKLCDFGMANYDLNYSPDFSIPVHLGEKIHTEIKRVVDSFSAENLSKIISSSASTDTLTNLRRDRSFNPSSSDHYLEIGNRVRITSSENLYGQESNIGSLPYAAPELLQPCPIASDRKADIWAFGIMSFALVTLKLPFWHVYEPRLKLKILDGNWESEEWKSLILAFPELIGIDGLIRRCLVDRETRCDINDILDILSIL